MSHSNSDPRYGVVSCFTSMERGKVAYGDRFVCYSGCNPIAGNGHVVGELGGRVQIGKGLLSYCKSVYLL